MKKSPQAWNAETLREVADFFGVALATVKSWRAETSPMPGEQGAWPLDKIAQWRQAKSKPAATHTKADKELRKLDLDIAERELKIQRITGSLVSRVAAKTELRQQHSAVKARLEAIPEEMVSSLPPDLQAESLATWQDKIELICKQIDGWSLGESEC